jgi:hydroxymethylglutaryl-CoA lyase
LDRLIEIAKDLPRIVGHEVPGQVMKAGQADRKYAKPDWVGTAKNQIAITSS